MTIQITEIWNICLAHAYFPSTWKTVYTIMLPKPGKPPDNPKSYRPSTLLDCIGNILDKRIANRLSSYLESRKILPLHQYGFRNNHSALDAILKFQTNVTRYLNSREALLVILLDIEPFVRV